MNLKYYYYYYYYYQYQYKHTLTDKRILKVVSELEVELILGSKSFLSHDSLHGHHILTSSVVGVQLVGHGVVVVTSHSLTNSRLHQTGQRGQHVNGRIDTALVQSTIQIDLTLGNVSREIGNRMGNIIVGHGQNGKLGNGTITTRHTSSTLVQGG